VLFVTHDLQEAILLADRILFLSQGPARVIGEAEVGVPRDMRLGDTAVYARFQELKQQFDNLYEDEHPS
jgi:NitT/TauT family transport system ATP-binding protein